MIAGRYVYGVGRWVCAETESGRYAARSTKGSWGVVESGRDAARCTKGSWGVVGCEFLKNSNPPFFFVGSGLPVF